MTLRMRVLPRFPARISGTNGIQVVRDGLDLVVQPDYESLIQAPAINVDTSFFEIWNSDDDSYLRMSFGDALNVAVPIINTAVAAAGITPAENLLAFRTNGYNAVGDGGGALYRFVDTEPTHEGKIQTADGRWWELSEPEPNILMFGAVPDGAFDGTGTDASTAVQNGVDYLSLAFGGGDLFAPSGPYRISNTVFIKAMVRLRGSGPAHSAAASAVTQFIADLSLATVFETDGGGGQQGTNFEDLCVTRQTGDVPAGSVGIRLTKTGSPSVKGCFILRHAAPIEWNSGATALLIQNCTLSQATEAYMRIKAGPQITLIDVTFGQNGGLDLPCPYYIEVDKTDGGKIDTFNAIRCQFNSTCGGDSATDFIRGLINFINYSDPDGIFNFVACHAEHFRSGGNGHVITADANTVNIPRVTFDSACTILTSTITNNFFDIPATCQLSPFIYEGKTSFTMNLSGSVDSVYKIEGILTSALSCSNARELLLGGLVVGNISLSGTISSKVLYGIYEGTFTDTSTSLSSSITATRLNGQSRWLTNALNVNSFGVKDSAALRSVNHALQVAGIDANSASALFARWSANASSPLQEFYKSRGTTFGSHGALLLSDNISTVVHTGDDGTNPIIAIQEDVQASANATSGVVRARKRWQTRDSGGTLAERVAIEEDGTFKLAAMTWNAQHLICGAFHFWVDSSSRLRIKSSAPTSDTDGTVVGSQS